MVVIELLDTMEQEKEDQDINSDDDEEEETELLSSSDEENEDDDGEIGGSDEELEGEEEQDKIKEKEISGWADSIAKILKSTKPKNKKELILSRARKDYEVNKTVAKAGAASTSIKRKQNLRKQDELEIVPLDKPKIEDKDEKEESSPSLKKTKKQKDNDNTLSLKVQRKLELKQKKLELAWENLARLNAEKTDPQLEKDLVKVATKGVVQLFNAISMQQKTIKTKLKTSEKSEFKKDKVLHQTKDIFDNAMSKSKRMTKDKNDKIPVSEVDIKSEESSEDDDIGGATVSIKINKRKSSSSSSTLSSSKKKKPVWNALQDDFMLDAKLKDWDKDSDTD